MTVSDELDIPAPGRGSVYRTPRHKPGLDPEMKRLGIIAGAVAAVLLLIVGVWSAMGHRSGGVPVIAAQGGPVRVKPENPGGMQVTGATDSILSDNPDGSVSGGKLAPPPETPELQALRDQRAAAAAPATAAMPTTAAIAPQPVSLPSPAQPAPVAAPPISAAPEHRPTATAAKPAPRPAPVQTASASATSPAPAASSRPAAGGHTQVQLAALSSEEAAKVEWSRLEKKLPSLFAGRHPMIVKAEVNGHVFWRLRTGGFADIAQATEFCSKVRAKGGGCSIAAF